jgi:hypothetical protein
MLTDNTRAIADYLRHADEEPYTRVQAFMWRISEAARKPHRRTVGSVVVDLGRGQRAHSLRFLAKAWQWSEPKVRRFLTRLKTDAMIDARTDAGVTVLTLCNYDRYQRVSLPSDAATSPPTDAEPTQTRRQGIQGKERYVRNLRFGHVRVWHEPRCRTSSGRCCYSP